MFSNLALCVELINSTPLCLTHANASKLGKKSANDKIITTSKSIESFNKYLSSI